MAPATRGFRMNIRAVALVYGIVFLLVGLMGFIPGFLAPPHTHPDMATTGLGYLLGPFPVNVLHNLAHLAFGVLGLLGHRSFSGSRGYLRLVAVAYGALAVVGLIPVLNTTFGLIPLFGRDIWLHVLLAAGAAYFGFLHREADATAV